MYMDVIKIFAKKCKRTKKNYTNNKNIDPGLVWFGLFLGHINHCKLLIKSIFIHINSCISDNSV